MVSAARLLRALAASAQSHGCAPELTLVTARDWASALFVGARYDVRAVFDRSENAEHWLAALPLAELPMPRQFASDVRVIAREETDRVTATVEALVLED